MEKCATHKEIETELPSIPVILYNAQLGSQT